MTLPSDAADPQDPDAPEDLSQTSGFPLPSSEARGEDLRQDLREEETGLEDPHGPQERVLEVTEPTTEARPGSMPDESQGPP